MYGKRTVSDEDSLNATGLLPSFLVKRYWYEATRRVCSSFLEVCPSFHDFCRGSCVHVKVLFSIGSSKAKPGTCASTIASFHAHGTLKLLHSLGGRPRAAKTGLHGEWSYHTEQPVEMVGLGDRRPPAMTFRRSGVEQLSSSELCGRTGKSLHFRDCLVGEECFPSSERSTAELEHRRSFHC